MDDIETRDALNDLLQTLEDSAKGFDAAADKLEESTRPDVAAVMRDFGRQRMEYHAEVRSLASRMGFESDASTVRGALDPAWMAVMVAISADDPKGVIDAADQGEDHALGVYRAVCDSDLDGDVRTVVERQMAGVTTAHDQVKQIRDSFA
jgi:uncharacterized protein (TIGR02284 family)